MSASIDRRLSKIEAALGIHDAVDHIKTHDSNSEDANALTSGDSPTVNLQSRIQKLQESTDFMHQESSLTSSLNECDRLARDLSPSGLLLTTDAANPSSSESIHRKQEILARYEELQNAFEALEKMRDLLIISNPSLAKKEAGKGNTGDSSISVDHIVSAPILSSSSFTFAADPVNENRLESLSRDVLDVRERSYQLSRRVDAMVDRYYSIMDAVNEKMVSLQEETTSGSIGQ